MFNLGDILRNLTSGSKPTVPAPAGPIATHALPSLPAVAPAFPIAAILVAAPRLTPADAADWVAAMTPAMARFQINTPQRQAAFIAQAAFESGYFQSLSENLNYSAAGLMRTFSSYFSVAEANDYARNPERIANRVYANRLGNNDEASGDGWLFRGRGLFQLTGRYNYGQFGGTVIMNVNDVPAYLETKAGAAMSAAWFWDQRGLNAMADGDRFTLITQRINGGTNGLDDRKLVWSRVQHAIGIA